MSVTAPQMATARSVSIFDPMVTITIWPTAFARDRGGAAQWIGSGGLIGRQGRLCGHVAALDRLKAMYGPGESHSNVILRLANETPSQ
jgi:hypothetical protein